MRDVAARSPKKRFEGSEQNMKGYKINGLERRLERLEQQIGAKHGPRLIYLMPNLEEGVGDETLYNIKISSDVWAHVFGAPLTDKEIRCLKEKFIEERHRVKS